MNERVKVVCSMPPLEGLADRYCAVCNLWTGQHLFSAQNEPIRYELLARGEKERIVREAVEAIAEGPGRNIWLPWAADVFNPRGGFLFKAADLLSALGAASEEKTNG